MVGRKRVMAYVGGGKRRKLAVSKSVKSYVRRAIDRVGERKLIHYSAGASFLHAVPKTYNLMYQAGTANGTDWENKVIANKLQIREIIVRGQIANDVATLPNNSIQMHIAIVKYRDYYTATSIPYSSLFVDPTPTLASCSMLNKDACTVLVEKRMTLQPQLATSYSDRNFELKLRSKMNFSFEDLGATYAGRDTNLYLVVYLTGLGGTIGTTTSGGVTHGTYISFVDI